MRGIIVDSFETLITNGDENLKNVITDMNDLQSSCFELGKKLSGEDVMFLSEKMFDGVNQINNVIKKIQAYQILLRNVVISYKYKEYEVASMMNIDVHK